MPFTGFFSNRPTTRTLVAARNIRQLREPIAELAIVCDVNSNGLRNQQAGESVDLHLERVVAGVHAAGYDGSIEAPVAQDNAFHRDCAGIGRAGGRPADGDVLAGKQAALVEEELREGAVHPVDRVLLRSVEINGCKLAEREARGCRQQAAHVKVEARGGTR